MYQRDDYDELLRTVYRQDPYFQKLEEVFDRCSRDRRKNIVDRKRDIYFFDLNDKFQKHYIPFLECLIRINFQHKDCFKFMIVLLKKCLSEGKPFLVCRKMYIINQVNFDRMTFNRVIRELEEKNMIRVQKENDFVFTPIMAPLSWNLSEKEREEIKREVERDMKRLDDKWILQITD